MENLYNLYLPVAGLNVNAIVLLLIGLFVGVLSGMCGVGGTVILLPILLALHIPINTATVAALNQMLATSFATTLTYANKRLIDYKFATFLLMGSAIGVGLGTSSYYWLASIGKLNLVISIGFFVTLSAIGMLSAGEVAVLLYYRYKRRAMPNKSAPALMRNFKFFQAKFISMNYESSLIFPILLGTLSGSMVSLMGFGGSIVMTPVLLHVFNFLPAYIVGTISFTMVFTALASYTLHIITFASHDWVLSIALLIGAVFGSQIGSKIGTKLSYETFKILLSLIILFLCVRIFASLFMPPLNLYEVEIVK